MADSKTRAWNTEDEPEASKRGSSQKKIHNTGYMSKGYRSPLKELLRQKLEQIEQVNKVVLDYNSVYKMNTYQPILY